MFRSIAPMMNHQRSPFSAELFAAAPVAAALFALSGLSGFAEQSPPESKKAEKVTYEDHVKPIFRQHCLNCHNQGEQKGGVALDSYQALMEGGGSGEVVYDDGDVEGSRLWQLVSHEDTPIMPPNQDRIADDQLAVIRAWIEGGILENSGSKAKAKKKNNLAFVAVSRGKPDGPAAMPETVPMNVPVVTDRPAATTAIACSPWAPLVAVGGQRQIVLYHSRSGELMGVLPFAEGVPQSLRFSRDGSYLIAGGGEHAVLGIVAIYDVRSGERVLTAGDELDIVLSGDATSTLGRVALGGPQRMLRVYDAADGTLKFDLKKHTDWILAVAYSPDDVLIASGDRSAGLVVWEADTGLPYLDLAGHKGSVNAVAWRDDSNVLASASDDGTVKLWDMHTGAQLKSINVGGPVADVSFDHEARLVTATKNGRVTLWDANGGKLKDFPASKEAVLKIAITHDGKRVIYGDWAGQIVNSLVEEPEQTLTLASNPPDESELLRAEQARLQTAVDELDEIRGRHDALAKNVAELTVPLEALRADIGNQKAAAEEQTQTAERLRGQIEPLRQEIETRSSDARDLQDVLTAIRVGHQSGEKSDAEVSEAELRLGNHLVDLAGRRQQVTRLKRQAAEAAEAAKKSSAAVEALSAELPERQAGVDTATAELTPVAGELQAASARVDAIRSRVQRLRDAVN